MKTSAFLLWGSAGEVLYAAPTREAVLQHVELIHNYLKLANINPSPKYITQVDEDLTEIEPLEV